MVEAASNDGYMLKLFAERGIPVLGIDPAKGPVEVAVSRGAAFNLSEGDRPERAQGRRLSWNWLRVLGVQPALGRGFMEEEEIEGRDQVALISHGLWQRRFGADPDVLGSNILLDSEPHTIVGVMPPDFWFQSVFDDIWVPFAITGEESRNSHYISVLARVKDGFTQAQAADETQPPAWVTGSINWVDQVNPGWVVLEDGRVRDQQRSCNVPIGNRERHTSNPTRAE